MTTRALICARLLERNQSLGIQTLPRLLVDKPFGHQVIVFHRWKHGFLYTLQCCPILTSTIQHWRNYSSWTHQTPRVRSLSTTALCCGPREDQNAPDSDFTYIEKELEAENKVSKKQKRSAADLRNSAVNVGRFVPDKILELLDEGGTSLGTVNRDQAVALSREKKLKLVVLKPQAKPWPLYKLMTGQELHQEQLKRNEKMKKKAAPTQVKEIKASWNIGEHDLNVRRRQLGNWFSDEHSHIHVRVTVTGGKELAGSMKKDGDDKEVTEKQAEIMEQLVKVVKRLMAGMEERVTLNSPPQLTGKFMTTLKATIRAMSPKEKAVYKKSTGEQEVPSK